ncbi:MAG: choice-of-anchor M domain-containing protein [Verrucomicrobiota bacterium]|nr:choice-of-anchor M domain-containing protein [Verrucomicrobiota bacterium]
MELIHQVLLTLILKIKKLKSKMNKYILFNISLLLVIASPKIINAQENEKWSNGHGDLSVNHDGSEWSFSFRHEDAIDDQIAVLYQNSKEIIPEDSRFNFLGDAGAPIWIIPQVAQPEILFLGMNAESTTKGVFREDHFNLELTSIHAPGDFFIWKTSLNEIDVDINSSDGITESDRTQFPARAHFHKNWGFNSPGTYRIGFTANGALANGGLSTESEEYFIDIEVNVVSVGEVDLEIVYEDGEWEAEILNHVDDHGNDDQGEDDHGEDHHDGLIYPVNEVALRVDSRSATVVPNDPAFGFLGRPGELFYELPQHEEEGLLYLGIASDEVEAGVFVGDEVQLNLKSVEGPGEVYLYSTDTFGKPTVMFNSADGISESDTFVMKAGAHSHQSLAFSEAGIYRIGFDFSGNLAATGEETRSGEFQLLFEVEELTVLSKGEVDLEIVYEDGEWEAEILAHVDGHGHDDHGEDDHGEGVYATSEVLLRVDSRSSTVVPNDPAFGFLGHPGELFYELPQHEEEGLLYLGIASDEVETGVFVGDEVQLNLKSVEGPGEVYLYSTDTFGNPTVMFNSADGISESDTFVMKAGAHAHQSMAFSEAGTYRVGFDFSGKLAASGEETRSGEFQLLFEVEEESSGGSTDDHYGIEGFSKATSPFSLTLQTKAGMNYIIEASHDLKQWGEIGEIQGTGSSVEFTDWRKALFQKQYYRVKLVD